MCAHRLTDFLHFEKHLRKSSNAVQRAGRTAKMFFLQAQLCKSAVLMFLERETPNCTCNPFLTGYMKVSSSVPSVKGDEMQWQGMTRKRCFGKKAGLCGSA